MMLTDLLLLAGAIVALAWVYGLRPLARFQYRHIPGPTPGWLWGNGKAYIDGKRMGVYQAASQRYGRVFKVWLGAEPTIIISDAELGRLALLRNQTRAKIKGAGQLTLDRQRLRRQSAGLFSTQDPALHSALKKAWMPAFNSATLAGNAHLMEASAIRLGDLLEAPAKAGETINIWRAYGRMTLEVVGEAAFGVEFNTQSGSWSEDPEARDLIAAVEDLFRFVGVASSPYGRLVNAVPELQPLIAAAAELFPDESLKRLRKAGDRIDMVTDNLVKDARAKANASPTSTVEVHVDAGGKPPIAPPKGAKKPRGVKPGSFPTMMVTATNPKTKRALDDVTAGAQTNTFLLAGYETTATSLSAVTYYLARHPDKQRKLHEELDRAHAEGGLSLEQVYQLPYMEACYKEAMRLYSPLVAVERTADQAQDIGGFHIPKGTRLMVPIYSLQHDAKYWPDPEAFLPERWLEGTPEHHPHTQGAWMPFGEGTRICAGQRFALQEIKITLARLLHRYFFQLAPGQEQLELTAALTLAPASGTIDVIPVLR